MNYSLYKLTSPSGKVYIGQTKRTPVKRWQGHLLPVSGFRWITNGVKNKRFFDETPPEGFIFGKVRVN